MTLHRRNHAAGFVTADFGVVIKARGHPLDLVHVFNQGLAALLRQEHRDPFAVLAHIARGGVQQIALFDSWDKAPIVLGFHGRKHRAIGIFAARARNIVDRFFGRGILNRESFARKTRDKFAINEHFLHSSSVSPGLSVTDRSCPELSPAICLEPLGPRQ